MRDLGVALALLLIIEGLLPFLAPDRFREAMRRLTEIDSKTMRWAGFVSMIAGLALLYLVRS